MKLEDQVCSFELVKKLKYLGVKQDSLFYWWSRKDYKKQFLTELHTDSINEHDIYSAYTVGELGDILPKNIIFSSIKNDKNNYIISTLRKYIYFECETEADARASMLIYLIENNLVINEWKEEWLTKNQKQHTQYEQT